MKKKASGVIEMNDKLILDRYKQMLVKVSGKEESVFHELKVNDKEHEDAIGIKDTSDDKLVVEIYKKEITHDGEKSQVIVAQVLNEQTNIYKYIYYNERDGYDPLIDVENNVNYILGKEIKNVMGLKQMKKL